MDENKKNANGEINNNTPYGRQNDEAYTPEPEQEAPVHEVSFPWEHPKADDENTAVPKTVTPDEAAPEGEQPFSDPSEQAQEESPYDKVWGTNSDEEQVASEPTTGEETAEGKEEDPLNTPFQSEYYVEVKPSKKPKDENEVDLGDERMFDELKNPIKQKKPKKKKKKAPEKDVLVEKHKKAEKKSKNRGSSTIALKVLIALLAVALISIDGVSRVEKANALIGSTQLPGQSIEAGDVTDLDLSEGTTPDSGELDEDADSEEETDAPMTSYKYIDAERLDAKTPTDLAVWYMTEFSDEEGASINEKALAEFNDWYKKKAEEDASFDSNYQNAVAYVKANPHLLNPPTPEPATKPNDNAETEPDGGTTVITPVAPTPVNPTEPTTPSQPVTPQPEQQPAGKYPHIDEDYLNKASAADVANWVYINFDPDGTNWDYQALTDYYTWLDTKDSDFVAKVNGYLRNMGWSA